MLHDVKGCGSMHVQKQYNYHVNTAMHAPPILQARKDAATLRVNVHRCARLHQTRNGVGCFAMSVQALRNADVEYLVCIVDLSSHYCGVCWGGGSN